MTRARLSLVLVLALASVGSPGPPAHAADAQFHIHLSSGTGEPCSAHGVSGTTVWFQIFGTGVGTFTAGSFTHVGRYVNYSMWFCVLPGGIGYLSEPTGFHTRFGDVGVTTAGATGVCVDGTFGSESTVSVTRVEGRVVAAAMHLPATWTISRSVGQLRCTATASPIASSAGTFSGTLAGFPLSGHFRTTANRPPSVAAAINPAPGSTHPHGEPEFFRVRSIDPDGHPYRAHVTIRSSAGAHVAELDTPITPSGEEASASAPLLAPGSYTWTATAVDALGAATPPSPARSFSVEAA